MPVYRTHVAVMHYLQPIERLGVPWPAIECPAGVTDGPCRVTILQGPADHAIALGGPRGAARRRRLRPLPLPDRRPMPAARRPAVASRAPKAGAPAEWRPGTARCAESGTSTSDGSNSAWRGEAREPYVLTPGSAALRPTNRQCLCRSTDDDGEAYVVMTRRSPHLRKHSWEVSFPGGRKTTRTTRCWHTALREAHEEIGLDPSTRPAHRRARSLCHRVKCVVGEPVGGRVAGAAALDLAAPGRGRGASCTCRCRSCCATTCFGKSCGRSASHYRPITFFELDGDTVWGATAAMLRQLLAIATGTDDALTH